MPAIRCHCQHCATEDDTQLGRLCRHHHRFYFHLTTLLVLLTSVNVMSVGLTEL